MTTAIAPEVDLAAEVRALQAELQELRGKRETAKSELAAVEAQTAGISSRVALNKLPPQAAIEHTQKINVARMKFDGLDGLVRDGEARLAPKFRELNRQHTEAAQAAELEEVKKLEREGKEILDGLTETLAATVDGQMARYTEVVRRLGKIQDAAARGVTFPIPAPALAARTARNALNLQLSGVLEPVKKLLR